MDGKSNRTRRGFVKGTIGSGALAAGLSSTTVAQDNSTRNGAEPAGIQNTIRRHTQNGDFDKATRVLENHDVDYSHTDLAFDAASSNMMNESEKERAINEVESDYEVQPEVFGGVFDKDESDVDFLMYNLSGSLYTIEIVFDHTPQTLTTDCLAPNDLLAMTYSDARWQYEPDSENIISGDLRELSTYENGVKIEWHYDAYPSEGETSGHFAVMLRKADAYEGDPSNVWAHYKHVYTPFYKGGCYNGVLGTNVSVSAGNVSVSLDTNSWEKNDIQSL